MHFARSLIELVCLLLVVSLSGCATIVSESRYPVSLNSYPQGAKVEVLDRNGVTRYTGTTPATTYLNSGDGYFRKARYNVRFSHPGYGEQNLPVSSSVNGWYWGNFVIGGLIGFLIVDPISGAMYELDNSIVSANLVPLAKETETAALTPVADTVTVPSVPAAVNPTARGSLTTLLEELEALKKRGLLTEAEYQQKRKQFITDF